MSKNRRRGRSQDSLRRSPGDREPRFCILIVCEGEKTEPYYFDALRETYRLSTVEVEVVGGDISGSAPISVVNHALEMMKRRKREATRSAHTLPFDLVWCVFDKENPPHASFQEAINKADQAKKDKVFVAVSTPSFEYWYLLHFENTDRPFNNADEVIHSLKKHLPDYDKKDTYNELADKTKVAIQRADRVWRSQIERFQNPSTSVHKLVRTIIKNALHHT